MQSFHSILLISILVGAQIIILLRLSHKTFHIPRSNQDKDINSTINQFSKSFFYIYPWNSSIIDRWPQNYTHFRLSVQENFYFNFGAGLLIDPEIHAYHTHQYALFTIFYQRLLESPFRTNDPTKATLFFIPYDIGMDASVRQSDGALTQTNCPTLPKVMSLLTSPCTENGSISSCDFARKGGRDHFLLHSINHFMTHFLNPPCWELYELCTGCTKLSIDVYEESLFPRYPKYFYPLPRPQHVRPSISQLPSSLNNKNEDIGDWISIPFPSNYHLPPLSTSTTSQIHSHSHSHAPLFLPWLSHHPRPFPISFLGTPHVTAKKQRRLREMLISECERRGTMYCLVASPSSHQSLSPSLLRYRDLFPENNIDDHHQQQQQNKSIGSNYPSLSPSPSLSSSLSVSLSFPLSLTISQRQDLHSLFSHPISHFNPPISPLVPSPAASVSSPSQSHPPQPLLHSRSLSLHSLSSLCLAPGGDFPTRKGFFDALLSGCLPVVFEREGAETQWGWNWGKEEEEEEEGELEGKDEWEAVVDYRMCFLYIERERVFQNVSLVFDELLTIAQNETRRFLFLQCVAKYGHRMQYRIPSSLFGSPNISSSSSPPFSLPPSSSSFPSPLTSTPSHHSPYYYHSSSSPPLPDAFDVILSQLFKKAQQREKRERERFEREKETL